MSGLSHNQPREVIMASSDRAPEGSQTPLPSELGPNQAESVSSPTTVSEPLTEINLDRLSQSQSPPDRTDLGGDIERRSTEMAKDDINNLVW